MTICEAANEFIRNCESLNYSPATVTYYKNTLHNFSLFYDLDNYVETINEELVQQYKISLVRRRLADKTVKTYVSGLRTILYYFMRRGLIYKFHITLPKASEEIKDVYTDSELRRLLVEPDTDNWSFAKYRNSV